MRRGTHAFAALLTSPHRSLLQVESKTSNLVIQSVVTFFIAPMMAIYVFVVLTKIIADYALDDTRILFGPAVRAYPAMPLALPPPAPRRSPHPTHPHHAPPRPDARCASQR